MKCVGGRNKTPIGIEAVAELLGKMVEEQGALVKTLTWATKGEFRRRDELIEEIRGLKEVVGELVGEMRANKERRGPSRGQRRRRLMKLQESEPEEEKEKEEKEEEQDKGKGKEKEKEVIEVDEIEDEEGADGGADDPIEE